MTDEDVIAAFRATIESRIPDSKAAIVEVKMTLSFRKNIKRGR
jgi:hypothetical protein